MTETVKMGVRGQGRLDVRLCTPQDGLISDDNPKTKPGRY